MVFMKNVIKSIHPQMPEFAYKKILFIYFFFLVIFCPVFTQEAETPYTPPPSVYALVKGTPENSSWIPFSLNTKIMKDGSIIDGRLGWNYKNAFTGEIRGRWTNIEKNEEFNDVKDSLNAVSQKNFEMFLLPFEYAPIRKTNSRLWLGIGGYFNNETLTEKGFFNMTELEDLNIEPVNSYMNNFSIKILGPVFDFGYTLTGGKWFIGSVSISVVPIFATWANQTVSIVPLLIPGKAKYSQNLSGSPYIYGDLSGTISIPQLRAIINHQGIVPSDWKLWISILYDYSRLQYEILDFNYDGSKFIWYTPKEIVVSQSLKIEGALMIPIKGMYFNIGGGHIFDSMAVNSGTTVRNDSNYLIISGKLLNL